MFLKVRTILVTNTNISEGRETFSNKILSVSEGKECLVTNINISEGRETFSNKMFLKVRNI